MLLEELVRKYKTFGGKREEVIAVSDETETAVDPVVQVTDFLFDSLQTCRASLA